MAFTSAGFPSELVRDVFVNAQGHSSLAKLSRQEPLAFSGTDIMVFTLDGEVNLVAEGAAKGQHTGSNSVIQIILKCLNNLGVTGFLPPDGGAQAAMKIESLIVLLIFFSS